MPFTVDIELAPVVVEGIRTLPQKFPYILRIKIPNRHVVLLQRRTCSCTGTSSPLPGVRSTPTPVSRSPGITAVRGHRLPVAGAVLTSCGSVSAAAATLVRGLRREALTPAPTSSMEVSFGMRPCRLEREHTDYRSLHSLRRGGMG